MTPSPARTHPSGLGRVERRVWRRRGGGGKVDEVKLLGLRLRAALEGAHHFVPPTLKVGGRLAATLGERGGEARWSAGVS